MRKLAITFIMTVMAFGGFVAGNAIASDVVNHLPDNRPNFIKAK